MTGLLLARADGKHQASATFGQVASGAGFFLHVEDFDAAYVRMASAGIAVVTAPYVAPYRQVALFPNRWQQMEPDRSRTTRLTH